MSTNDNKINDNNKNSTSSLLPPPSVSKLPGSHGAHKISIDQNNCQSSGIEVDKDYNRNFVEDEDEDLKKALALSLEFIPIGNNITESDTAYEHQSQKVEQTDYNIRNQEQRIHFENCSNASHPKDIVDYLTVVIEHDDQSNKDFLAQFNQLMWDDVVTTPSDKQRWKKQGISSAVLNATNVSNDVTCYENGDDNNIRRENTIDKGGDDTTMDASSMSQGDNLRTWGLTQNHGGPCGVLAAVQAEMLRILLFGRPFQDVMCSNSPNVKTGGTSRFSLSYPQFLDDQSYNESKVTVDEARQALAGAFGIILARAALSQTFDESTENKKMKDEVTIFLPLFTTATSFNNLEQGKDIILSLSTTTNSTMSGTNADGSRSTTISLETYPTKVNVENNLNKIDPFNNEEYSKENGHRLDFKRQKGEKDQNDYVTNDYHEGRKSLEDKDMIRFDHNLVIKEKKIEKLARAVTEYLLSPQITNKNSCTFQESNGCQEEDSLKDNQEEKMDLCINIDDKKMKNDKSINLEYFFEEGGVMLFVMSLVKSRGIQNVQEDMDDATGTHLTSQFGHSSQELINLLLTGRATSNVFDNSMTVSGAFACRGIFSRPSVGYLSQLESLRYCEVGGFYKSPIFPVWVVGSTSHFTVLYGNPSCLKESESDVLLEQCRREFRAVQGEGEDGFIKIESLQTVLQNLNLMNKVNGENGLKALTASLEVTGAGIILWDDFWKVASRLLTGASLENALQEKFEEKSLYDSGKLIDNSSSPLLKTQFREASKSPTIETCDAIQSTMDSDEEMARRLAAEWGSGPHSLSSTKAMTRSAKDNEFIGQKTDEDLARELQDQWNAEDAKGSNAVSSVNGYNSTDDKTDVPEKYNHGSKISSNGEVSKFGKENENARIIEVDAFDNKVEFEPTHENKESYSSITNDIEVKDAYHFEKFGDTFPLYHYNGLRGGTITPFQVTRLSPEEAVGMSIALSSAGLSSGLSSGGRNNEMSPSGNGDLEDVVRTKWPSCTFHWSSNGAPCID